MAIKYIALPTDDVRKLVGGELDANGQLAEKSISDDHGNPCRHCLQEIPLGEPTRILAYRPFAKIQLYAEVGPIFCVPINMSVIENPPDLRIYIVLGVC
ncbi:MAG: DUF1203 domain-containing protein [Gammaproteobacteria bacterium]|nr:DUF1203 domain-containing protein [Gammaproteobacteria bacterium]